MTLFSGVNMDPFQAEYGPPSRTLLSLFHLVSLASVVDFGSSAARRVSYRTPCRFFCGLCIWRSFCAVMTFGGSSSLPELWPAKTTKVAEPGFSTSVATLIWVGNGRPTNVFLGKGCENRGVATACRFLMCSGRIPRRAAPTWACSCSASSSFQHTVYL